MISGIIPEIYQNIPMWFGVNLLRLSILMSFWLIWRGLGWFVSRGILILNPGPRGIGSEFIGKGHPTKIIFHVNISNSHYLPSHLNVPWFQEFMRPVIFLQKLEIIPILEAVINLWFYRFVEFF